ncbi:PQQ-like beta-propeller repeat protein [bacterium]|nr:PQQ-like beta-propeller repeat protein [bacterium]
MNISGRLSCVVICFIIIVGFFPRNAVYAYKENNDYIPGAFPKKPIEKNFTIPLDPQELIVIYPAAAKPHVQEMQALLASKCGSTIPFRCADEPLENELGLKHLIIIGNISDNRYALDLYKRRFAFADAYFPGAGGVIVHPAASIWNTGRSVMVIGVSRDEDIMPGFEQFVNLIEQGASTLGIMHYLKSDLELPKPPDSVDSTLDNVRQNLRTTMAPYWSIANWGLLYFLSGDKKWAEHFRDGFYLCHERAEKTGQWVPEGWTNLYFNLWKMVYAWELIDDDPFFTPADRKIIEEVLWGYMTFVRWLPNLDVQNAPLDEGRQNHTTFLALSLYYSHRYFTEKYDIAGLDSMVEKYRRAFDRGQEHSFRPNDDAGNYFYLSPLHLLTYDMSRGDDSFCSSNRLRSLIDLVTATIDNRRDPVSLGDVGGYSHRAKGSARGMELKFYGMGAWFYGDGQYQWLYNWGSKERVISLDTMKSGDKKGENPIQMHFGADRVFSVEDMYSGIYAVDIPEEEPSRFVGVFPVLLDEGALRWSSLRTQNIAHLSVKAGRYSDKISYRWNFDPQDEYMLLDGISTFSHGHLDGNTISRLTWKDRIWLFDLDYIKSTPKYHNGVTVTRNGIQEDPPPLTVLDCAGDFEKFGITRTTSRDYNGADWERTIIWRKGKYFLFLDRIKALRDGDFRLDARWRTRGDVDLAGNLLTVHQGDKTFFIKSADEAERRLEYEADGSRSRWNYPYGNGKTTISHARRDITMTPGDSWIFANLMYAVDDYEELPRNLYKVGEGMYIVDDSESPDLIGLNADALADEGVYTDCSLFVQDSRYIWLLDTTFLGFRNSYIEAPGKVHFEINYRRRTGKLIVPEESTGTFKIRNLEFREIGPLEDEKKDTVRLGSGTYTFNFDFTFKGDFWKNRVPFMSVTSAAERINPESGLKKFEDFGIERIKEYASDDSVTVVCSAGLSGYIAGDTKGRVTRYDKNGGHVLFTVPSSRPVTCMAAADVNHDGSIEIIAGDDSENLYCFGENGSQLWTHKLTMYYGTDANAVDIVVGDIDGTGSSTILVSTAGWKLYAFKPDGSVRWECFTYYHPETRIGILRHRDGKIFIAVGTEYHTPLNMVSPKDGKVIWYTWEEMGSEFLSVTDYCGFHLTDMVFADTNGDGNEEVVFGTKYNRIYALEPATGKTQWNANTGGEVTVMKTLTTSHDGMTAILVGTDAGDIILYNLKGERIRAVSLGRGITDIKVFPATQHRRTDIAAGTEDGRIVVLDEDFRVRAGLSLENAAVKQILAGEYASEQYEFSVVTDRSIQVMSYHPYYLKKSRHY